MNKLVESTLKQSAPATRHAAIQPLVFGSGVPASNVVQSATGKPDSDQPTKPSKMTIPFPAGSETDYAGRAIGTALSQLWSQPVVFESRVGAGSTMSADFGAKSPPDIYTLVMGIPAGDTIAPHTHPKLGYNPMVDFIPAALFCTSPLEVVIPTNSPFKTFPDPVAFTKVNPGKSSYASNGSGSSPHLLSEWFLSEFKERMAHVPYRGSAKVLPDLMSGRVDVMLDIIVSALPVVEGGKLRVLATSGAQLSSRLPDVPTIARFGYPDLATDQWYGLFLPKETPGAIVPKIDNDVEKASGDLCLRAQMLQRGAEMKCSVSKAFGAKMHADS